MRTYLIRVQLHSGGRISRQVRADDGCSAVIAALDAHPTARTISARRLA